MLILQYLNHSWAVEACEQLAYDNIKFNFCPNERQIHVFAVKGEEYDVDILGYQPADFKIVHTNKERKIQQAIQEQINWIHAHGRDLNGYVDKYGKADDPNKYGNGGEAIYEADVAELERLRKLLRDYHDRQKCLN
jgi:hypothetical protein